MTKADDYCGAKSCSCRADDYDPAYWDYVRKENSNQDKENEKSKNQD